MCFSCRPAGNSLGITNLTGHPAACLSYEGATKWHTINPKLGESGDRAIG
jgi:hypothetical protein